jgi:hypothetical protein
MCPTGLVTGKLIREDEDEHQPRRQRQGWMKRLDLRGTGLDQIACLALRGRGPVAINFLDCRSRSRCRHVLNRSPLFLPAPGGRGPAAIIFSASNPRRQSHCRPGEILSPPPSSFCRSPVSSSRQGGSRESPRNLENPLRRTQLQDAVGSAIRSFRRCLLVLR